MEEKTITKCPHCGGETHMQGVNFCPFCGNSLAENEPMSREERLKMYEYEDQAVPHKSIVINKKSNSNVKSEGIIVLILNGKHKRDYKKIADNPDEIIEGRVRRFDAQKSDEHKGCDYYVYVRVENPKPMIFECQYYDLSIYSNLRPEQIVKIYRKGNEYVIMK